MDKNLVLKLALDAGETLISCGAETYRAEDTVVRILSVMENSSSDAFAIPTGIFATITPQASSSRTSIRRILSRSTNLEKIERVNSLSRRFVAGKISLDDAIIEMQEIKERKPYSFWFKTVSFMLTCTFFTFLFDGNINDALCATFVGFIAGFANSFMSKRKISSFLVILFSSMFIGFFAKFFLSFGIGIHEDKIIIACLMPLVPGVALTNAVRDILSGDYLSGVARIVEALAVAVATAVGIGLAIGFYTYIF